MKEKSYYKKLKARKDKLKTLGFSQIEIQQDNIKSDSAPKIVKRWTHPKMEGVFTLREALSATEPDDISKIKKSINSIIDVLESLERDVQKLKKAS